MRAVRRTLLWVAVLAPAAAGLVACPTVDLGEVLVPPGACRPDPSYFRDVIWPEYIAPPGSPAESCVGAAGCHRRSDGRSSLRLVTDEPLTMADQQANYDVVIRFLNCAAPEASSLLTKPLSGVEGHGGGDLFAPGSAQETTFLSWFPN